MGPRRTLIVGSAGRDYHVFNTVYRHDSHHRVLGFTSSHLCPDEIATYPPCLAGPLYPEGVPILCEDSLEHYIVSLGIKDVVLAYHDVPEDVALELAGRVLAAGADLQLLSPERSMLAATKPVVAVSSTRSGAGKSPTSRYLARLLRDDGLRVAIVRHPMLLPPFAPGTLHRSATIDGHEVDACAGVRREPLDLAAPEGTQVYSGFDYEVVLAEASAEADVLIWDGGGSDLPFIRPSLHILVADPLRAGDAVPDYPGDVGLRLADVVLINKCNTASIEQIEQIMTQVDRVNPAAQVLTADSPVTVEGAELVRGRTVTVIEDHISIRLDSLRPGAGMVAARELGVSGIISPRPYASGQLARFYRRHPGAFQVLPVLDRTEEAMAELAETLAAVPSEAIINATQLDLSGILPDKPVARASYQLRPHDTDALTHLVRRAIKR